MPTPKVRFVIETVSTWHRNNGYSSHFATITSTMTGRSATFDDVGGAQNAEHQCARAMGKVCSEFALTFHVDLPTKQWKEARKYRVGAISKYENAITAELLASLEVTK